MKIIYHLAWHLGLPALAWAGFIEGVEGAANIVRLYAVFMLPLGLMCLSETMQKKLAADPPKSALHRTASRVTNWFLLLVMAWAGTVAVVPFAVALVCAAIGNEGVKRIREGNTSK